MWSHEGEKLNLRCNILRTLRIAATRITHLRQMIPRGLAGSGVEEVIEEAVIISHCWQHLEPDP